MKRAQGYPSQSRAPEPQCTSPSSSAWVLVLVVVAQSRILMVVGGGSNGSRKSNSSKSSSCSRSGSGEKRQHLVPCALPQIPGYRCWASRVVSQTRDSSFISELNVHGSLYMELLCLLVSSLQGATMVLTLRISRCFDLDHLESWLRLVLGDVSSAVSSGGEVWKQRSLFKNLEVQGFIRVRTLGFVAHNSGLSVLGLVPLRQHDF